MKRARNKRTISYRFTHENHSLTEEEIIELEDIFLSAVELPSGFYVVNPLKDPESIDAIVDSYYPLLSFNNTTLRIWFSFSQFIYPLDEITDNCLININTMNIDSICPDGFLKGPFKEDRILGYGQQINLGLEGILAFSLSNSKMKDKIERYKMKDATEIVEILSYCVYLFFFSTHSVFNGSNVCIDRQWETNSFHEHFAVYMLYGFIAHHSSFKFETSLDAWAKFLSIENESIFLDKLVNTKKGNVPELIYHYCQYLDKYGDKESSALNYALSKITVNRYCL